MADDSNSQDWLSQATPVTGTDDWINEAKPIASVAPVSVPVTSAEGDDWLSQAKPVAVAKPNFSNATGGSDTTAPQGWLDRAGTYLGALGEEAKGEAAEAIGGVTRAAGEDAQAALRPLANTLSTFGAMRADANGNPVVDPALRAGVSDSLAAPAQSVADVGQGIAESGKVDQQLAQKNLLPDPGPNATAGQRAAYIAQQTAAGLPTVGLAVAGTMVDPALGAGLIGAQSFGQTYEGQREEGKEPGEATAAAARAGAINAATAELTIGRALSPETSSLLTRLAQTTASGDAGAVLGEADAISRDLGDGKKLTPAEIEHRLGMALGTGTATSLALGVGGHIAHVASGGVSGESGQSEAVRLADAVAQTKAAQTDPATAAAAAAGDPVAQGMKAAGDIIGEAKARAAFTPDVTPPESAATPVATAQPQAQPEGRDTLVKRWQEAQTPSESAQAAQDIATHDAMDKPQDTTAPNVTVEPFAKGSRVLFRGDVDQIKSSLDAAGLPSGMTKLENGKPVGMYFPASHTDSVSKALGLANESPTPEAATAAPGYAESVEPIQSGNKILFRGDVDAMRQRLSDAGLDPGYAKVEDGARIGVYFPKAVADKVAAVLKPDAPLYSRGVDSDRGAAEDRGYDTARTNDAGELAGRETHPAGSSDGVPVGAQGEHGDPGLSVEELPATPDLLARFAGNKPSGVEAAAESYKTLGTQSPEFKQWFGASKMKDAGNPVEFHHATNADFDAFSPSKAGSATGFAPTGLGHWFGADAGSLKGYGDKVLSGYLKLENPKVIRSHELPDLDTQGDYKRYAYQLKAQGHDGIYMPDSRQAVAFDASQFKTKDNRGTFAKDDPRMRFSKDNAAGAQKTSRTANQDAQAAAEKALGKIAVNKLKRNGVEFKTRAEIVAEKIGGHTDESQLRGVKGLTTADRSKAVVVTDNVAPHEVAGVLAHEVFHKNAEAFIGSEPMRKLTDAIGKLVGKDRDITAAAAKVPEDTPSKYRNEETAAYLAEDAPNHPLSTRLIDEAKLFLNRRGVPLDWINGHAAAVRRIAALTLHDLANKSDATHVLGGDGAPLYHKAYHGTPHDFDQFSMDRLGTGEGGQAYGHGLYFAGNKDVADHYRKTLSSLDGSPEGYAAHTVAVFGGDAQRAKSHLEAIVPNEGEKTFDGRSRQEITGAIKAIDDGSYKAVTDGKGRLYHVDLAPDESHYLHWEKPLKDQSEHVQAALKPTIDKWLANESNPDVNNRTSASWAKGLRDGSLTGEDIYKGIRYRPDEASKALSDAGIPGIKYLDGNSRSRGEGNHNYVIFDDKHVKIDAKYSRYTPEQEAALAKAGIHPDKTLGERLKDSVTGKVEAFQALNSDAAKQAIFDRFNGIAKEVAKAGPIPAEQNAYISTRMATNTRTMVNHLLTTEGLRWEGNVSTFKEGVKGLLPALEPVRGNVNGFLGYVVGRRAAMLKVQGRENNLSDADISALAALRKGHEKEFDQALKDYNALNKSVVDFGVGGGIIDPESRSLWEHSDYVPFFRETVDESTSPYARSSKGLNCQKSPIQTLKGGRAALKDPLSNIIQHYGTVIDSAVKNKALLHIIDTLGSKVGIDDVTSDYKPAPVSPTSIKQALKDRGMTPEQIGALTPEMLANFAKLQGIAPPKGPDTVRVMRDGKPEYYRINDPDMLRAITGMKGSDPNFLTSMLKTIRAFATASITSDPTFLIRTGIKHTAYGWLINPDDIAPGLRAAKGLISNLTHDENYRRLASAGALFGHGQFDSHSSELSAKTMRRALRDYGWTEDGITGYLKSVVNTPMRLASMYKALSAIPENANRIGQYRSTLERTGSQAEALYNAKDQQDYTMGGDSKLANYVFDTVPFIRAHATGIYKMHRAGALPTPSMKVGTAAKGAALMLATIGYRWWLSQDPEKEKIYQGLQDYDKELNWHFFLKQADGSYLHFRVPKPFETGYLYAAIPEHMWDVLHGNETLSHAAEAIGKYAWVNMYVDPVPFVLQPPLDVRANKKRLFESPIETENDEGKMPSMRYDSRTSPTMVAAGKKVSDFTGYSPKQMEYLWSQYMGPMGQYALGMADVATRHLTNAPEPPAKKFPNDYPVIGKFVKKEDGSNYTRYVNEFYDLKQQADEASKSLKAMQLVHTPDAKAEANAFHEANKPTLANRAGLDKVSKELGEIHKKIDQVANSPTMSGQDKRVRIDELQRKQNELTERAYDRANH